MAAHHSNHDLVKNFPIIRLSNQLTFHSATRRLCEWLRQNHVDSVLAGLSGGADSTLLYYLLFDAKKHLDNFKLGFVNVNYHLRGDESDRDTAMVKQLREDSLRNGGEDVVWWFEDSFPKDKRSGISLEMECREFRHALFQKICETEGFQRIATGHNADDNVETMLMNMLRGSGVNGLSAMKADNGSIIRPLLDLPRREVLRLLSEASGVAEEEMENRVYVTDSSNLTSDFRRNFLRNEVIPLMESRWEGARKGLYKSVRLMGEENEVLKNAVSNAIGEEQKTQMDWMELKRSPSPLTLLHDWLSEKGLTFTQAEEMLLSGKESELSGNYGRRWSLEKQGIRVEVVSTPSGLRLEIPKGDKEEKDWRWMEILPFTFSEDEIRMLKEKCKGMVTVLAGRPEDYCWRRVKEGERIAIMGKRGTKLVSDVLREAGISKAEREGMEILERKRDGKGLWIPGIRRSGDDLIGDFSQGFTLLFEAGEEHGIPRRTKERRKK